MTLPIIREGLESLKLKGEGARCFLSLSLVDVMTGHPDHVENGQ